MGILTPTENRNNTRPTESLTAGDLRLLPKRTERSKEANMSKSKVVLYVSNLSSKTRSHELKRFFDAAGPIYEVERDVYDRCALVEFKRESDAKYAWNKFDGKYLDGRDIKVDWATKSDFKKFGWKWTEYTPSPSRSRSGIRDQIALVLICTAVGH